MAKDLNALKVLRLEFPPHQGRHRQEVELEASEKGERVQDRFQGDPGSAPEPDVADFRRNSLRLKKRLVPHLTKTFIQIKVAVQGDSFAVSQLRQK